MNSLNRPTRLALWALLCALLCGLVAGCGGGGDEEQDEQRHTPDADCAAMPARCS